MAGSCKARRLSILERGVEMSRWDIYELLKGSSILQRMSLDEIIKGIEKVGIKELREGVTEYLMAKKRELPCKIK